MKNIGNCLLSGKNIVGFSLPIRIFEPRSAMERVVDGFQLFPYYMKLAREAPADEKMKYILAALVGGVSHTIS